MIKVKRIYDPPAPEDGFRILVDRLWARGLTKDKAGLIYGSKKSPPVMNYANGTPMTRRNGQNLRKSISKK